MVPASVGAPSVGPSTAAAAGAAGGKAARRLEPAVSASDRTPEPRRVLTAAESPDRSRVLASLVEAAELRTAVEVQVREQVASARSAGASWRQIGAALEVSHVAALKRYR